MIYIYLYIQINKECNGYLNHLHLDLKPFYRWIQHDPLDPWITDKWIYSKSQLTVPGISRSLEEVWLGFTAGHGASFRRSQRGWCESSGAGPWSNGKSQSGHRHLENSIWRYDLQKSIDVICRLYIIRYNAMYIYITVYNYIYTCNIYIC